MASTNRADEKQRMTDNFDPYIIGECIQFIEEMKLTRNLHHIEVINNTELMNYFINLYIETNMFGYLNI